MTIYIIIFTAIISILAFQREDISARLMFNPYVIERNNEWYRFVTCGFIHADWIHLGINMFVLYNFGEIVEDFYSMHFGAAGPILYVVMYLLSIALANVRTFYKERRNPGYNALGASGAVSAVLFVFILFVPLQKICLYGLLCLPGIIWGVGYLVYSSYASRRNLGNINHDAHFYGALAGVLFTLALEPKIILNLWPF